MNKSQLEHALIALAIQALASLLIGPWWAGSLAVTLFIGREIAQNEYRIAHHRGWQWGEKLPVKWHEGIWKGWTRDSVLDVLAPLVACLLFAALTRSWPLLS
ncbi:hypothetical protein [Vreelandella sp. H-I2]